MATAALDTLEEVFKALADATRLRILALLGEHEVCVCHIHDSLGVPQPTASRHLAYLRRAGLVDVRREGVWMHYRLSQSLDPVVAGVVNAAVHALSHVPLTTRDRKQLKKCCGELAVVADGSPRAAACCTGHS
jgi:ArsR family transcriptional regulator